LSSNNFFNSNYFSPFNFVPFNFVQKHFFARVQYRRCLLMIMKLKMSMAKENIFFHKWNVTAYRRKASAYFGKDWHALSRSQCCFQSLNFRRLKPQINLIKLFCVYTTKQQARVLTDFGSSLTFEARSLLYVAPLILRSSCLAWKFKTSLKEFECDEPGNPYCRWRINTVNLLVPASLDILILIMQTLSTFLLYQSGGQPHWAFPFHLVFSGPKQ